MSIEEQIRRRVMEHQSFVKKAAMAERYYANENDIIGGDLTLSQLEAELAKQRLRSANPLRNADNRISHNWHQLLVDQKTSYAFTSPSLFSTGNSSADDQLTQVLGDDFTRYCKDLCVEASNTGVAWLHYWLDADGAFQYAPVPTMQVVPVYDSGLRRQLIAVIRCYREADEEGTEWERYEYWTTTELRYYRRQISAVDSELQSVELQFQNAGGMELYAEAIRHPFDVVPFTSSQIIAATEGIWISTKG